MNTAYSSTEIASLTDANAVLTIHRSSVKFDNILFTSHYNSVYSSITYIELVRLQDKTLTVYNSDFKTEGTVVDSRNLANLNFENITMDLYKSQGGIFTYVTCMFPEPVTKHLIRLKNVDMYYSADRPPNLALKNYGFMHSGDGDLLLDNVRFQLYSNVEDLNPVIALFSFPH